MFSKNMFGKTVSNKTVLNTIMTCKMCQDELPNLLFDPAAPKSPAARAHLALCPSCAREFAAFASTLSLLDTWQAPAVSPYFDQKLAVRLREEQAAAAPGWFERLKTQILLNTGRQLRPALAGAMALLVIAGAGSIGLSTLSHSSSHVQVSATVNDLKVLDKNDQALQQMDQLLQDDIAADGSTAPPQI